jgi:uncharacterized membrane protein
MWQKLIFSAIGKLNSQNLNFPNITKDKSASLTQDNSGMNSSIRYVALVCWYLIIWLTLLMSLDMILNIINVTAQNWEGLAAFVGGMSVLSGIPTAAKAFQKKYETSDKETEKTKETEESNHLSYDQIDTTDSELNKNKLITDKNGNISSMRYIILLCWYLIVWLIIMVSVDIIANMLRTIPQNWEGLTIFIGSIVGFAAIPTSAKAYQRKFE